jgi:Arc/MetJ-type ribon-helix-helix transcriptional regulator
MPQEGRISISLDFEVPAEASELLRAYIPIRISISIQMSTKVIPVRLREQELKQIDQLVEYGVFRSRSEAIREIIKLGVEIAHLSEVFRAVDKLFELERMEGRIPIDLSGATQQLLEEREMLRR